MKVTTLVDNDGTVLMPRTHIKAVVDDNGNSVQDLLNSKADKSDLDQSNLFFFFCSRENGAQSSTFTYNAGSKENLSSILSHLKMASVKDGQVTHVMAPGRITKDTLGNEVKIDGTDGDIFCYCDYDLSKLQFTDILESKEQNGLGLGITPFSIKGHISEKVGKFAFSPCPTVATKYGNDTAIAEHCFYNTTINGTGNTFPTFFENNIKTSAGGYPNGYRSALSVFTNSRKQKSTDTHKYKGLWYKYLETWFTAMYLELGTLNFTDNTLFGVGITPTETPDSTTFGDMKNIYGNSGFKWINGNNSGFGNIMADVKSTSNGDTFKILDCIGGSGNDRYACSEILEGQRVIDNIVKNGWQSKIGDASIVFTDYGNTIITDGSVNLSTGAGMTENIKYYQVRNVPGCEGIDDGVMTAVVNCYFKETVKSGAYIGTTDMSGATVIMKLSHPIYRGFAFFEGLLIQTEGAYYVMKKDSNGNITVHYYSFDNREDLPDIVDDNASNFNTTLDVTPKMIQGASERYSTDYTEGWAKKADYSSSLWAYKDLGASTHTYEVAYCWRDGTWGTTLNNGYQCVNAAAVGCDAWDDHAGRTVFAHHSASAGIDHFAGAASINLS